MTSKALVAVLSTAAALSLATGVRAHSTLDADDRRSVTVRFTDLDLDKDAGARKLLTRISFAADQVCGKIGNTVDLDQRVKHRACVRETVENTLERLGSARVSQLYARQPRMTLAQYNGN
jgi:UrcA family protein